MSELLFYKYDLQATIENQGRALVADINSMKETEVLNTSQEEMVKYLIEKHRINPLAIDETGIQMNYGDAQIDVRGDFRRAIFDMDRPVYVTGTRFTFYVPFTGDSDLFRCKPSTYSLSLPTATVRSNELIFTYDMTNDRDSDVGEMFKRDLNTTQVHAKRVNTDVGRFNGALTENAVRRLNARREKLLKDRDLVASIGFPLRRRQDPPSTFVVPDVKRRITPRKPAASAEPFSPEPALGMDDYEHILSVLSNDDSLMPHEAAHIFAAQPHVGNGLMAHGGGNGADRFTEIEVESMRNKINAFHSSIEPKRSLKGRSTDTAKAPTADAIRLDRRNSHTIMRLRQRLLNE